MREKIFLLFVAFFFFSSAFAFDHSPVDTVSGLIENEQKLSNLFKQVYPLLGDYDQREKVSSYLEDAQKLSDMLNDDSARVILHNYYGLFNYNQGNYGEAATYFYRGLEIAESANSAEQKGMLLNNLGLIYIEIGEPDAAIPLYQQTYAMDSIRGDEKGQMRSLINMAICYQHKDLFDRAFSLNKKALAIARNLNDSLSVVDILNNQGTIAHDEKRYDESLDFYRQALEVYRALNDQEGIAITYTNMGQVHLDQRNFQQAFADLKIAQELILKYRFQFLKGELYESLSRCYREIGDYHKAYDYHVSYKEIQDSLVGEKKNLMIRRLEAQYNLEKKQRKILDLQQQNQAQQEKIRIKNITQKYMYFIIVLGVMGLVIVFLLLRKERKLSFELKNRTEELKKLNTAKDKFFSIIAHDLKNPFNALISYTSLLKEDFDRFTREEIEQIISDLSNATEQGFKLLENLLYWTRSQTNRIKVFKTRFNFVDVYKDVEELAKPNLLEKSQKIILDTTEDEWLYADKDMISTVLRNLVFNAIKFSYRDSSIHVKYEKKGDMLSVSVVDQGVGIHEDDWERIFQYDESTSTAGTDGEKGSGLGLIICREFVEKNGGKISVSSTPGKGSTFYFTVPLSQTTSNIE